MIFKVQKTDAEWQKELTPEQFEVARKKGTERAFTGAYWNFNEKGAYSCVCCGEPLFESDTKFDAGCGWPSFFQPISEQAVTFEEDNTYGMTRVEVMCSKCGAHLGHVFDDGPKPTGQRFCINSVSVVHESDKKTSK